MNSQNMNNHNETTLKDGILVVRSFINEVLRKWYVVIIMTLPFMIYFVYQHLNTDVNYQAQHKFIHESDNKSGASLGGILGQFGFGGGSKNNPYQLLEVGDSRLLLTQTLFEKSSSGDYLINDIITAYNLREEWSKKRPEMADFKYTHDSLELFTNRENITLKRLQNLVLKGNDEINKLRSILYDESGSYYEITSNTVNADLSNDLTRLSYSTLKDYYENKKREPLIKTTNLLEMKKDSIKSLREKKLLQLNSLIDRSRNYIYKESTTDQELLQSEITMLSISYGEAVKNYELSNFNLENSKETFLLLDRTFLPLSPVYPSWLITILKTLTLGLFVSITFIVGRKLYLDAMNS